MLSIFFGNDQVVVRQKAFAYLETLTTTPSQVRRISVAEFQPGILTDLAGGVSLFGGAEVIVLDTLSDEREIFETFLDQAALLHESTHQFVVIEGVLTAPNKKICEKAGAKITEIKEVTEERFNAFLLTDAFLRRDKKSLWLLLMDAWRAGLSNEEIIGVLFWQIKTLRLVERTKSEEEAGLKPFVYQKAKRALSSFKKGELDTFSRTLLTIYHDGHLGKTDLSLALEKWVLGV